MLQGNCPLRIAPLLKAYDALSTHERLHGTQTGSVLEDLGELAVCEIYQYACRAYPIALRTGFTAFRARAWDYLKHRKPRPRFQLWLLRQVTEITGFANLESRC